MPTLDWIGKQAVVNHHRKVPYHLLRCDRELSAGDPDAGNLLVQGDNLLALKALLPYYAGKVKCIYIDPPYNTGNEGWAYNDNRVINGYGDTPGLGGGFRFCKLGNPLFDGAGNIREEVRFADLAAHVFFTETGAPIPKRPRKRPHPGPLPAGEGEYSPLLGVHQGKAVYLLFNGVLGDKRPCGGNVLTHGVAGELPAHPEGDGPRVVYGEACRLGPKSLERYGITFRQVPYELKVD